MFVYEKKLQYPVKVATPNPKLAAVIISQYVAQMASWALPCAIFPSATPCPIPSSRVC